MGGWGSGGRGAEEGSRQVSRKLTVLQVKHLDFTVPSSPSGPPAPSLLPSFPILFQGRPHFNEGLRTQAFCSLFFGQSSAKWRWSIFAIFLFCKGRGPGRPWGKEVREFNNLLFLPLFHYFVLCLRCFVFLSLSLIFLSSLHALGSSLHTFISDTPFRALF